MTDGSPIVSDTLPPSHDSSGGREGRKTNWRLTVLLTNAGIGLLLALGSAFVLLAKMRGPLETELVKRGEALCSVEATGLQYAATVVDENVAQKNLAKLDGEASATVNAAWLLDANGNSIGRYARGEVVEPAKGDNQQVAARKTSFHRLTTVDKTDLLELTCPVMGIDAGGSDKEKKSQVGAVRLWLGTAEIQKTVWSSFTQALGPMAFVVAIAAALQVWVTLYIIGRLEAVQRDGYLQTASEIYKAGEVLLATVGAFGSLTTETAATVTETTSTMRELSQTSRQAASAAEGVIDLASKSERFSEEGLSAVSESGTGMTQLRDEIRALSERIGALSGRMQDVFEIASTVSELAERSNLLALNASIEAAKAGTHGKGFAVVASEMRNLAESSKKAVTQVKAIVNEVQKAMLATVSGAEEGSRKAESGAEVASEAGQTIRNLAGAIRESSQAAKGIAMVAGQQNTGIEQVLASMTDIHRATQEAVVTTRRAESAARLLNELASQLRSSVTRIEAHGSGRQQPR